MNRQDFYYDQLVKQMDLDLLQDNAERGIGAGLEDTWGTGLSSINIIAHENGTPDMDVLIPAGSARVKEAGTISSIGTLTNGSAIITDIPNTARLSKGDDITGTGVPASTKILTVDSVTQVTMDKNSTADGSAVDLTVTFTKYSRAVWIAEETIDCSQDWEATSTIPAAGKECYIACYVKQDRDLFDQRQDGWDPPNTIYYRQVEGAEFRVYKGSDATPGNAVKVTSPSDEYELVFEVLFDENTTVINDAADKYNPGKDEIDYTDVVFVRSQELKDALGNILQLEDRLWKNRIKVISSANYTILDDDDFDIIEVTTGASDRTITLPTLADNQGRIIKVVKKDTGAGKVIIDGEGAEVTGELSSISLINQNDFIEVNGLSSKWYIESTTNEVFNRMQIKVISSANYTVLDNDGYKVIEVTTAASDRTVTLPTLADNQGRIITIVKSDSGAGKVIVDGEGGEYIDESLTIDLVDQNDNITIYASSSKWKVIGGKNSVVSVLPQYDTGWINRSDWTNVHMGSNASKDTDSNVAHNFNRNLSALLVKVLVSTDGADNNSFEVAISAGNNAVPSSYGLTVYQIDTNNVKVQTGTHGIAYSDDAGSAFGYVDTEDWYYKIVVYKLT